MSILFLDDGLTSVIAPMSIGPSEGGQILFDEDRFVVGWITIQRDWGEDDRVCFGEFSPTGLLSGPPVCNTLVFAEGWIGPPRFAVGERGLLTLVSSLHHAPPRLFYFMTDRRGVMTTAPAPLVDDPVGYAATWMGDSFGALYLVNESSYSGTLLFQRFAARE